MVLGTANIVHAAADNLTPPPAGTEKPMHKPMRHHGMDMILKGLNLTDTQKIQIHNILRDSHKEMKRPSLEERRVNYSIIAADTFGRVKTEA